LRRPSSQVSEGVVGVTEVLLRVGPVVRRPFAVAGPDRPDRAAAAVALVDGDLAVGLLLGRAQAAVPQLDVPRLVVGGHGGLGVGPAGLDAR